MVINFLGRSEVEYGIIRFVIKKSRFPVIKGIQNKERLSSPILKNLREWNNNVSGCKYIRNAFRRLTTRESDLWEALSGSFTFKLEDTQYTMTALEMGYQKYFDQWKEQGLFN